MIRPKDQTALRAAVQPSRKTNDSQRTRHSWRMAGGAAIWLALLAGIVWSFGQLEAYVDVARPTSECRLEWADLPLWLTEPKNAQILRDITAVAGVQPEDDLRDPDLGRRIGENLLRCHWVAEVKQVTKEPSGLVRVHAIFREPFAFVELDNYAYLVDASGVRLPGKYVVSYVEERFWNDWFRIVGIAAPLPDEGQLWQGEDLAAALRLIQYLKQAHAGAQDEVPFRPALRAIDVANFRRRQNVLDGELRIRTVCPRSYIAWGLPPGEEFEVEAGASRKLEMLRSYYSEHGGQFPDGWVYDVRGADGIRRWEYKAR